jgi:RNA polymerase sigma factor (sigma-70 family)
MEPFGGHRGFNGHMSSAVADHELLDRWQAGDETAFTTLVQRHEDQAFRTAVALVGDPVAANDVMQEAFAQTLRSLDGLRKDVAFSTWLHQAIVWEARRYATRDRWRKLLRPLGTGAAAGADQTEPLAMSLDLVRAVVSLPRRQREVVVLRFYVDLTEAEVARALGCPLGTVKSRAARALSALAKSPYFDRAPSLPGGSSHV